MRMGLISIILIGILIAGVVASSEVSEEKSSSDVSVNEDNSVSAPQDNTNLDVNEIGSDNSNSQSISDVVSDSNPVDVPNDAQIDSNEDNNIVDDNQNNEGNSGNDNKEKITICHKPGTPAEKTLEIPEEALDAHLGHGDYTGECNNENTDTNENSGDVTGNVVSNIPNDVSDNSGNSQHDYVNLPKETISNKEQTSIVTNSNQETQNLKEKEVSTNLNSITGMIILDSEDVIICHKSEQTMKIPKTALNGHLEHGDYTGFCSNINFKADAGYDLAVNEKENVNFHGSSGNGLNIPVDYIWNFGDGAIIEGINMNNPIHIYNNEGVYYVKLIVKVGNYISEDRMTVDVSDTDY